MIVGITGKAGSGKDTAADFLVQDYGFVRRSFADPLKHMLAAGGWPEPKNRDDKEKAVNGFGFSWREAAQKLGTEWGRELDPDIWVKALQKQLFCCPPSSLHVLPDVRFENEARMVRDMGGIMLFMSGRQAELGAAAAHASEAGVKFYPNLDRDIIIDNRTTITSLHDQLRVVMALGRKS